MGGDVIALAGADLVREIKRLAGLNEPTRAIAAACGCSAATAWKWSAPVKAALGLPTPRPPSRAPAPFGKRDSARIERLMADGMGPRRISKRLGLPCRAVERHVRDVRERLGIAAPAFAHSLAPEARLQMARDKIAGINPLITAERLGVHVATVYAHLKKLQDDHGLTTPRVRRSDATPLPTAQYIEEATAAGQSARSIARNLKMNVGTVTVIARKWRARNGMGDKFAFRSNRQNRNSKPPSGAVMELVAAGAPIQAIAEQIGGGVRAARIARRRAVHVLGPDALCPCGKSLGHRGGCSHAQKFARNAIGSAAIARMADLLKSGMRQSDVAQALSISIASVSIYGARIIPALRASGVTCPCGRQLSHAGRCSGRPSLPETPSTIGDSSALLGLIRKQIPRGVDQSVKDEVISDVLLAVIDGSIAPNQIAEAIPKFISRAFGQWANQFGPRSLDAVLGDDDGRRLMDFEGDDAAEQLVGDVRIGDLDSGGNRE